jgi:hypothetical protein
MNYETGLFDHSEYGEAFIGMAKHVTDMTMLERQIFEDCTVSAGRVVAPHLNTKGNCAQHLRPEIIQHRAGCSFAQAVSLCDAWSILEATPAMVEKFCNWVKAKGVQKAVAWFENLAMQLAEVEFPAEDHQSLEEDPYLDLRCQTFDEENPVEEDDYAEYIPDTFRYHLVGENPDADEKTWQQKQPAWYCGLLNRIRFCQSSDKLAGLGKQIYSMDLSHGQAGVIWHEYGRAKSRLLAGIRQNLSASARNLLVKINSANGNLGSIGALMYKIQHGQIQMAEAPADHEWIILWQAYNDRKAAHV